jgi:CheY-like chemotaxis protein
MSGIQLARAIASIPAAAALPLILLSSMGVRETSEDAAGEPARFAGELSKPLKPAALRSMLIQTLGGGETRRQADVATTELDPGLGSRHPLRILLAEDNAVNQRLALRLLEKMGYSADVAANGLEAIQAVERQTYDLILMDVQMPEMDGLEATRQIVSRWTKHERPRIVAMTADAMQEDRDRCLEAGMDHYLTKPVRNAELVAAIEGTERRDEPPAVSDGGPASPTPAISQETLDRLVDSMGDPAFVAELLETFTGDANTMLDELDRSIRDGDVETARRTAHTLKSNAATFGAVPLSDACRQLEALARTGDLEGAPELAELVRSQYERASVELIAMKAALEGV